MNINSQLNSMTKYRQPNGKLMVEDLKGTIIIDEANNDDEGKWFKEDNAHLMTDKQAFWFSVGVGVVILVVGLISF